MWWQATLPSESVMQAFAGNFTIIAWIAVAGTTVLASVSTYEITQSLNSANDS